MEKQILLKDILQELNQLPETYLRHWLELIHAFRERLANVNEPLPHSSEEPFDWDEMIDEIMANREQSNLRQFARMKTWQ
ncbi:MAG: hypothetical protein AAB316_09970 [Bacteroidota bacterium]